MNGSVSYSEPYKYSLNGNLNDLATQFGTVETSQPAIVVSAERQTRQTLEKLDKLANRLNETASDLTSVNSCVTSNVNANDYVGTSNKSDAINIGEDVVGFEERKQRDPDYDSIKMFVGQVPREWSESELYKLFDEFGQVHSINILKDKKTGLSRGCCFVTFYTRKSAVEAQNALHNIKVLPSMHHPIQMKPADSENRNERKLFVGMVSKKCMESDIRQMFSPYGTIEECLVLKDSNGQSKGCAFITYSSRASALNAIKMVHHSQTMEGCASPIVVKFADTQKEKDAKKQQQMLLQQLWSSLVTPQAQVSSLTSNPYLALAAAAATAAQQQQQQQLAAAATLALQQQIVASLGTTTSQDPFNITAAATLASNPVLAAALCGGLNGTNSVQNSGVQSMSGSTTPSLLNAPVTYYGTSSPASTSCSSTQNQRTNTSMSQLASMVVGGGQPAPQLAAQCTAIQKQPEGPDGANLFIYHLPPEFADNDLSQTFLPFGSVISSKVFIDKQTNLSKCFGFVSYDNPISAQAAIQAMNGFQIGNKRLKVQLKRTKEKPY